MKNTTGYHQLANLGVGSGSALLYFGSATLVSIRWNKKMLKHIVKSTKRLNLQCPGFLFYCNSLAAKSGEEALAIGRKLLERKANPDSRNALQRTPLHVAALSGNTGKAAYEIAAVFMREARENVIFNSCFLT